MTKTIVIDGVILEEDEQKALADGQAVLIQNMKDAETLKLKATEDLNAIAEKTGLDKKYIKKSATDMYKWESGKLDLNRKNDEDAAISQCHEIYQEHHGI